MTKRQVYYSFHYKKDNWRVQKIRQIGVVEKSQLLSPNEWEEVKGKGDANIKKWIDENLNMRSCVIVLIGEETASRGWVKYEIKKGWNLGKGVCGIYIHNIEDSRGNQSKKGANPFDNFTIDGTKMSSIVPVYDSPHKLSKYVYDDIANNLTDIVEKAIEIRKKY